MKTSEILSLVLIFCFSIFTIELYAQAPNFIWTKRAGGVEGDYGHSIAVDSTGNSFIAGHFYGIVKFDTITLTSTGGYDLFIAKYDSSGNVLWAKQVGGIGYVEGNSIVIDKRGNSFITGYFDNSVAFETTILNSYGGEDIFIAKYNPSGKILWVKKVGGIENDCGEEISIDGSGNLYLTGSFWGTANFDNVSLTSRNGSDTFAAKYDSLGNLIWVKQPSGIGSAVGKGIATDKVGNSVVTGFFERTATFGTITLTSGSIHWPDFFIAKYDSAGNVLWAKQAGGNYTVEGSDIAINESGESIVMGSFENTVTFGNTTFTTSGNKDIFIVKYDSEGNLLWAKQLGGYTGDEGHDIAIINSNSFLITGEFGDIVNFGSTRLTSWGHQDIFIAKYDDSGNIIWVKQAGGTESEEGSGIAADGFGNSYITGSFCGNAFFDDHTVTSAGVRDIFIAKLDKGEDTVAPSTPKNLQATSGDQQVTLTWSSSTDSDLAHYKVYRSRTQSFTPAASNLIATLFKTDTSYIDTNVINGQTYYYRISAVDTAGNESEFSDEVSATPQAALLPCDISLSASNFNFGNVLLDSTKKRQLTVKNVGQNDLIIHNIVNAKAVFSAIPSTGTVTANDSITITLSFTPIEEKVYLDTFSITSNDPDEPIVKIAVFGQGVALAAPSISLSETAHDFGSVPVFSTSTWQLTLQNQGKANLEIQAIESNNSVFAASISKLTIAPNSQQQVQIKFAPSDLQAQTGKLTIVSNDPNHSQTTVALAGKGVDTQAPQITQQPSSQQMWLNTEYQISAQVTDNFKLGTVWLNYRKGADANYQIKQMSLTHTDIFSANIPASALTFEGLAYFFKAEDSAGNISFSDTLSNKIYFADGALSTNSSNSVYHNGYPRGQWHMLSVPAVLNNAGISAVLNDETELGNYGEPNWRLFSYEDTNGDGLTDGYKEFSLSLENSLFRLTPGKAFWFKANPSGEKIEIDVETGNVLPLEPITISLKPGWNQIGNPFAFPIAFSPSGSDIVNKLYSPDGSGGYSLVETMTPFAGYFVYVEGTQQTALTLFPVNSSLLPKPLVENCDWLVQLTASCGICQDEINYFGISESSATKWDKQDYPEPPTMGDFISLCFPHGNWDVRCKNYTTDIRQEMEQGQIWDLVVETNQTDAQIKISWLKFQTQQADWKFSLFDKKRNRIIDMNAIFEYSYLRLPGEDCSYFQIFAGKSSFVERQLEEIRAQMPENYSLSQNYPNPFNASTTIHFALPKQTQISLTIFDLLGKEIRIIVEGRFAAGQYEIELNAADLTSGLYFYRLAAENFNMVRKLVILR